MINPISEFYSVIDSTDEKSKLGNLPLFPRAIELEITNHCNFHCIMCKTGLEISERGRGVMEKETFEKLMSETSKYASNLLIKFVGLGESLINKDFLEFAKMAKKQGHICHLTTNGSLLTDEHMESLIEMEFDSVKFSFQGVDHDGYKIMRRRDDFEDLIEKIRSFKKKRDDMGKSLPYITIGTSITNESDDCVNKFKDECIGKVCDKLEIGMTNLEAIDLNLIKDESVRQDVAKMKDRQELNKVRLPICNQVFDVITVRWNGDVSSCCADADGLMVLGNLRDNSIKELWNCSKQNLFRQILANKDYEALPLCKNCYDFMGFMGSDNRKGQ